ncbi:MAG: ABC transporter permease [Caldiserica bacterium]|nr:MAG: ABC transporter permease [Caldisericota bacterium]
MFKNIFSNLYGIGQVLFKATPLIFAGLGVAIAFKGGIFNIGGEGQIYMGALLTAITGIYLKLPAYILLPLSIIAGFIGGGIWGLIPGYFKAKYNAHEVITTIMLNFIAIAITNYLTSGIINVPETVRTKEVSCFIPRIEDFFPQFKGSALNLSFFIAILLVIYFTYYLYRTKSGFELRVLGESIDCAEYSGVNIKKKIISTMFLSGGLCGLVGINFVLGYKHYFEQGFSGGAGFMAIAVALLGNNTPFGVFFASLLFGILSFGGLIINAYVPKELVDILQAVIILSVISFREVFKR